MKKKIALIMATVFMMSLLVACGDQTGKTSKVNPDDYVKLGEYKEIDVVFTPGTITDEQVAQQMEDELNYYIDGYQLYNYDVITDRTVVEDGDLVNINYVGKKDGVAFDGGTADNAKLEIGSNSFIDGFEAGLIGVSVGETVDLDLTFPEEYSNAELAGAAVVFTVSVNSILDKESKTAPKHDDALIATLNGMGMPATNITEYRDEVKEYLENEQTSTDESNKSTAIWDAVYANATISNPPEDMVKEIKDRIYANAEAYATSASVDFDTFLSTNAGMTAEEFEAEAQSIADKSARERLLALAIAKAEKISFTEEEVRKKAAEEATSYGLATADEYLAEIGYDTYYDYLINQEVNTYLAGVVNLVEQ